MPSSDAARPPFRADYLKNYVVAMNTIDAVHVEVPSTCRRLLESALPSLTGAIGVHVTAEKIEEYRRPATIRSFAQDWAWLGVTVELIPKELWFSLGLYFDNTGGSVGGVEANASFDTATSKAAASLFEEVSPTGSVFKFDDEDLGVFTAESVPSDHLESYEAALSAVLQRWLAPNGGLVAVANNMARSRVTR